MFHIILFIQKLSKFLFRGWFVILLFLFTINNFIGNTPNIINADGYGYYDYLKSIFYDKDFVRYNKSLTSNPEIYKRISAEPLTGSYIQVNDYKVNKYPPGTALLISPFFLYPYLTHTPQYTPNDGYQINFHKSVFYAAVFYLFLALWYLRKLLRLFMITEINIFFIQCAIVFTTSITRYAHAEAAYSHIYSFFAITAFLYYTKKYYTSYQLKHLAGASLFLGLIVLIRNINILILLFTPFLASNFKSYINTCRQLFSSFKKIAVVFLALLPFAFIQMLCWYLQTGKIFVYSYGNESFDFLNPHIPAILFSYQKGLFIYHPVLLISFAGIAVLISKKQYYRAISWLLFFFILTYILSSWWIWTYGCSFGQRVYVDYLTVFFILIAIALNELILTKSIIIVLLILCAYLNIIQTYQYKEYILHWEQMDKEKYWKIFLKTHPKYGGLVWRDKNITYQTNTIYQFNRVYKCEAKQTTLLIDTLMPKISDKPINAINLGFENIIDEEDNSKILLEIRHAENNEIYFSYNPYLIHFENEGFNKIQKGTYIFKFPEINNDNPYKILIYAITDNKPIELKNLYMELIKI